MNNCAVGIEKFCSGEIIYLYQDTVQRTINGTVIDSINREPIPGVNIIEKGTQNGTITDNKGVFTLQILSNEPVLIFSYIGYKQKELVITTKSYVHIALQENIEELDEIVVVGYGKQKKSDITGALTGVDARLMNESAADNITQLLQGKAAGLEIIPTSTRPGSTPQIRIRGNRSLSASNDPLFILDGIPFEGNINSLNPQDVVSVEVLKDASATAIYGSRGSNGVILISTKKGHKGRTVISYSGYCGVSSIVDKYEVYNGEEFRKLREISGYRADNPNGPFLQVEQESIELGRETDWQDLIFKNGYITDHNLSSTGGSDDTQYSLSLGYYRQTTVIEGQEFKRYSLRGTIDHEIGKYIKLGVNTLNSAGIRNGESASVMYNALALSPLSIPYDSVNNIVSRPASGIDDMANPLLINNKDSWKEQRRILHSFNSIYGEIQLLKSLKYRANAGIEIEQTNYSAFFGTETPMINGNDNWAIVNNEFEFNFTIENLLYFDKVIRKKHFFNVTGLFSYQEYISESSSMQAEKIIADYIQYYNFLMADITHTPTGDYTNWALLSYMGRINYNYDNRFLFTFTSRADGSSRLAPGKKWHYYPAAAFGWNIHNESFMKGSSFITLCKLRLSYGQTSNTAIDPYKTLAQLTREPYSFGNQNVYGYYVSNLANYNLGWEYTQTTNFGIDYGFMMNKITGSIEYYRQETKDILMQKNLPPSSGIGGTYLENIGKTRNQGLEFSVDAVLIENRSNNFRWDINFNIFFNREKIIELADSSKSDIGQGWFVGHPVNVIYDHEKSGIWQTADSAYAFDNFQQLPGQIRVKDLNNDNEITDDDRKIIGYYQPKWQGGFTTSLSYKNFDLSIVTYARIGGWIVSSIHQPGYGLNTLQGRRNGIKVDYWTPENPTNNYPKPNAATTYPIYGSTMGYFDGTFVKIRNINLGYSFPLKVIEKAQISSLRIYFTAQNPFILFSPYVKEGGIDPEPTSGAYTVGLNTPPVKSYIIGINVKF